MSKFQKPFTANRVFSLRGRGDNNTWVINLSTGMCRNINRKWRNGTRLDRPYHQCGDDCIEVRHRVAVCFRGYPENWITTPEIW